MYVLAAALATLALLPVIASHPARAQVLPPHPHDLISNTGAVLPYTGQSIPWPMAAGVGMTLTTGPSSPGTGTADMDEISRHAGIIHGTPVDQTIANSPGQDPMQPIDVDETAGVDPEPVDPGGLFSRPNQIVGDKDDRVPVDTRAYPYRAAVWLGRADGSQLGTGWLVNENTVITAAHVVTHETNKSWEHPGQDKIIPGRHLNDKPWGSCGWSQMWVPRAYIERASGQGDQRYDYAIIKLDCNVGKQTGWFAAFWTTARLKEQILGLSGYPGNLSIDGSRQYYHNDYVRDEPEGLVVHGADATDGQSGSPVFQFVRKDVCPNACVMGVHTGSWGEFNRAVRFSKESIEQIRLVMQIPASRCAGPSC